MIIYRKDKRFEQRSDKPNENWTEEDCYIVEDGSNLANKIIQAYPFYEFITDKNGNLVDVIPTERPPQPVQPPTTEERLQMAEDTILFLLNGGM